MQDSSPRHQDQGSVQTRQVLRRCCSTEGPLHRKSGAIYMSDGYLTLAILNRGEATRAHQPFRFPGGRHQGHRARLAKFDEPLAGRPSTRPFAEHRAMDPDGNLFDVSVHGLTDCRIRGRPRGQEGLPRRCDWIDEAGVSKFLNVALWGDPSAVRQLGVFPLPAGERFYGAATRCGTIVALQKPTDGAPRCYGTT